MRGNSSASHPKKSYKLKLDEKTKMFSLGEKKDRHWAMIASYNDMSLLRNKMAGDFANEIGSMGMKSTWADCILNGEYMGTYLFIESIRISSGRVNVFDSPPTMFLKPNTHDLNVSLATTASPLTSAHGPSAPL